MGSYVSEGVQSCRSSNKNQTDNRSNYLGCANRGRRSNDLVSSSSSESRDILQQNYHEHHRTKCNVVTRLSGKRRGTHLADSSCERGGSEVVLGSVMRIPNVSFIDKQKHGGEGYRCQNKILTVFRHVTFFRADTGPGSYCNR